MYVKNCVHTSAFIHQASGVFNVTQSEPKGMKDSIFVNLILINDHEMEPFPEMSKYYQSKDF